MERSVEDVMLSRPNARFVLIMVAVGAAFLSSCRSSVEPSTTVRGGGGTVLIWEKLSLGIRCLALTSSGSTLAGSDSGRIYRTTNNGRDWQRTEDAGVGTFRVIIRDIRSVAYAANDALGIFRSEDDGFTWRSSNGGLSDSAITSLAATAIGQLVAGTRGGDVYLSSDLGARWTLKYNVARPVVACAEARTGIIYFSAWGEGMYRFRTSNLVPTAVSAGLQNTFITSIAITGANHLFLGSEGSAIYRSTNGGDSWVQFDAGFPNAEVSSLIVNTNDQLFAGTSGGVYTSRNDGLSWTAADSNLTSRHVLSLSLDPSGYLYAGTDGGIFRTTQSTTTVFTAPSTPPTH
jgi:photosystem II stability/assembly factor-like uncharacterized protein